MIERLVCVIVEFEFNPKQTMQIMLILGANAPFLNSHFFQTLTSREISSPFRNSTNWSLISCSSHFNNLYYESLGFGPSSNALHILVPYLMGFTFGPSSYALRILVPLLVSFAFCSISYILCISPSL